MSPFSSPSSHQATLPPTPEIKSAFNDPLTPSPASVYCAPPPTPGRPRQSRLCLETHAVCPFASEIDQAGLLRYGKRAFKPGRRCVSTTHSGGETVSSRRRLQPWPACSKQKKSPVHRETRTVVFQLRPNQKNLGDVWRPRVLGHPYQNSFLSPKLYQKLDSV